MQNSAMLYKYNINNNGLDTIIFVPEEVLGIKDLRSLGYYKNQARHTAAKLKQIL